MDRLQKTRKNCAAHPCELPQAQILKIDIPLSNYMMLFEKFTKYN
jgi:hypothetical protein